MAFQSHLWHWLWFSHPHALSLHPASKSKCLSFMFVTQQTLNSTSFTNYLLDGARDADDAMQNHRWLFKLFAREYLNSMQYAKRPSYLLIIYSLLIKKKEREGERKRESEYILGLKYRLLSKFLSICFGCNFPFRFANVFYHRRRSTRILVWTFDKWLNNSIIACTMPKCKRQPHIYTQNILVHRHTQTFILFEWSSNEQHGSWFFNHGSY